MSFWITADVVRALTALWLSSGEFLHPILGSGPHAERFIGEFRQPLDRDDILPVYDPRFVGADGVDWADDSLVIGVDLEGEAKAYPVGFLTRREMVVDNHRGIPTLVTW